MNNDKTLFKWLGLLLLLPLALAIFGGDRYRYPCQDPANWENLECKKPICEINRNCPEHIFKEVEQVVKPQPVAATKTKGAECK